jgi:hypothetical protein
MKDNYTVAVEVIAGLYGNGEERKRKLQELGYNYTEVQSIVNTLVYDGMTGQEAAARLQPQVTMSEPEPAEPEYLEVDYDNSKYKGIVVNIII